MQNAKFYLVIKVISQESLNGSFLLFLFNVSASLFPPPTIFFFFGSAYMLYSFPSYWESEPLNSYLSKLNEFSTIYG